MIARPIGPRVLVKELEESEERRESGIVLPDEVKREVIRGMVIETGFIFEGGWDGDDLRTKPLPIEKGELIVWRPGAGTEIKLENPDTGVAEEFLVINFNDVLLVLP